MGKMIYTCITLVALLLGQCLCQSGLVACPNQEAVLPCRCLTKNGEYQVWCSHSDLPRVLGGLRTIGKNILQPIDELILENNYLPSLSGRTFIPLRAIRLMLRYNGLERVSSDWLNGLEQTLMELYLVEPELKSLPEDSLNRLAALEAVTIQSNMLKRLPSFSNLPQLSYLQIESLSLTELSSRYFKNLPSLEKVHINHSPALSRLDIDLFQDLPSLKLLNISYTGLNWIHPRALSLLPVLNELSLVGNKVTDAIMIGRCIKDLPNLETLYLDFNVIERLDEGAFTDLIPLKKVTMSNNRIIEIRAGAFYRLPALKLVDLSHNRIRRVHPESFTSTAIKELLLLDNDISHAIELRAIIEALPRLTLLDMSYNNLHIIPFGLLRGHSTLERLNLDHNKIEVIERDALIGMTALRELSLKNNSLSGDLRVPMWNLPNLKGLDLSANFFRRIEPGLLTNLPSLRRVDFSSNQIEYINPLGLLDTPALEYVNLSYNTLVTLHPATFRHLIGLYELDISNNRLLQFVPGLPRSIEYLHLKGNNIANVPSNNSPDLDLPTLRMLDISSNSLKSLKRESFRTLPLLKKLYLGKNYLHSLEDGTFDRLSNLEILDLQGNSLVQIPSNIFNDMPEMQGLNLRHNKIHVIKNDIFRNNKHLKILDVSRNQVRDLHRDLFQNTRDLQAINASHNLLVSLPSSINGLAHLENLDLTDNRLGEISPDLLNSLKSLRELRLSENFIQELKTATFDNMENLKVLYFNNNELTEIQTNTFRALPALKHVKLNENKVKILSQFVFNDLPNLQTLELQENLIQKISEQTFHLVPHLLMLNLSGNLIPDMNQAGLQNLQSLEMLDVSFNRLTEVESDALEKMEWLVELKMDNNAICGVRSVSFNRMPRLRVLSLRNNKMMSFPERAVQKVRGNLAVLDIDGNPLACSCSLLWLRAWLQQASSTGPKCLDGTLLIDKRLSRDDCMQESRLLDPVAPGCESELLSVPNLYDSPHSYSPWMNLKGNATSKNNQLPSPEESELFYDDYLDYPYNETSTTTEKSSHFISGDTPTLYAASSKRNGTAIQAPKPISGSPSTSGFTIFGVPLSSFNLNNLWNTNARNNKKSESERNIVANVITKPLTVNELNGTSFKMAQMKLRGQNLEGKSAVVNKSVRGTSSRGMFSPSNPEIQTGGFIPLLPGTGGFKPITNPHIRPATEVQIEKIDVETLNASMIEKNIITTTTPKPTVSYATSMGHPVPIPTTPSPITTEISVKRKIETKLFVQPPPPVLGENANVTRIPNLKIVEVTHVNNDTHSKKVNLKPQEIEQIRNISEFLSTTTPTILKINVTTPNDIEILDNGESFEDIFKEIVENVSLPVNLNETITETALQTEMISENLRFFDNLNSSASNTVFTERLRNLTKPAFLIPGGQQPQFRTAARSTITKVPSPHLSSSASLLSNSAITGITPLPHNKRHSSVTTVRNEADKSWYFASYNESNFGTYVNNKYYENSSYCAQFNIKLIILLYIANLYVH